MISESQLDARDYHLHFMIERMQRDGRSEAAIENAVRTAASDGKPSTKPLATGSTADCRADRREN